MTDLAYAERLKFRLFAEGIEITPAADDLLRAATRGGELTPADYASTSGVILELAGAVWVNAPINAYNPNFVTSPPLRLDVTDGALVVRDGEAKGLPARFWVPPAYHGRAGDDGTPFTTSVFTHGDRARLSPIRGCAMRCTFCNIPFEDRYGTKPIDSMIEAIRAALADPVQPARHLLISGGTPIPQDVDFLKNVYETVITTFANIEVDIMMVPVDGLFDVPRLAELGLHQLSINIEVFDEAIARDVMPQKFRQGVEHYLDFIEDASAVLGPGRVRSMLMVGLEPAEATLAGVRAIAERGGVPVLSPFRPDPSTPLRHRRPPSADELEDVYVRARDIVGDLGAALGPDCVPCTHNTLTFAPAGEPAHRHAVPVLV